jgi:hypothetical protein
MSEASDDGGAVGRFFHGLFGRSWKTTITGAVGLVLSVLALAPGLPPSVGEFARAAAPLVLGGGLMFAKDFNASHTKGPPA